MKRALSVLVLVMIAVVGCGSEPGSTDDGGITFEDAAWPDADIPDAIHYDAFVCVETDTIKDCAPELGQAGCVDITSDPDHCGGCDQACPSPGMSCEPGPGPDGADTDLAHCECPAEDFLPSNIVPVSLPIPGFNPVTNEYTAPNYLGLAPLIDGSTLNMFGITFNITTSPTPIGTEIDLAETLSAQVPAVVAGYNINYNTYSAQAAYVVTTGTLVLDTACATGVSGTVTGATFSEVADMMDPVIVEGGCSFTKESITFAIGDDCGGGDGDGDGDGD